jgi:4-amino-4-deoxy-L-arabinose transferase-like glycosyltransferase
MIRSDTVVSAIGGVVVGYVLWLIAISIGDDVATVSQWSLVVFLGSIVLAVCAGVWGRSMRRRGKYLGAAFAFGLPILPVVLTLAVLTNIYV